jgi:hypothetical protein
MEHEDVLDLILRQMAVAEETLDAQRRRGENSEALLALLRSLRLSHRAFSGGVDPDDEAASCFVLSASPDGRIFLRRDHHFADLSSAWLRSLFDDAGIVLSPGQRLLVESEFARRAVEESLGETAAAARSLERQRADVQTALRQSSGPWKTHLLEELCRIDLQRADLPLRRNDLAELLQDTRRRSRFAG